MRRLLYLFFFASGLSALIYEVAWVRILVVDFGNTVQAVSTVLTIFMAGLALGAYLFGRRIDRTLCPLAVYARIELALGLYAGLFALAIPWLHVGAAWLLTGSELGHPAASLVKFLLAAGVLILPATLIGGTLPVLAKCVVDSTRTLGGRLATLYAFNTLGALFGCLGTAYVLILKLGVGRSILAAAAINIALGIGAALLARSNACKSASPRTVEATTTASPHRSLRLAYAVAFLSGLVTLATEVLWTRLLTNYLSGNVLIFATILGGFLLGMALGSFLVARWVDRIARLDVALAGLLAVGSLWLVGSVLGQTLLGQMFHRLHVTAPDWSPTASIWPCLAALFVIVSIAATAFGAVLPLLFRWVGKDMETVGRDVGRLYAMNTVGAIVGSFVSGFVMIWLIGVAGSLLLLAAGYSLLAVAVTRQPLPRILAGTIACGCLLLLAIPSVRQPVYWLNAGFNQVRRVPPRDTLFLKEGVEGTVGVAEHGGLLSLTVNGLIVAETTRSDLWDLLLKAHLPMLLHEDPRRVALVGLGAGISAGAVVAYEDVERIDCIEISSQVVEAHRLFGYFNNRCWEDPRLHLSIHDGRHFLLTTERRYDVISVDPVDPPICDQYTEDFFRLCHDRLESGGLMVQWVPLFRLSAQHVRIIMKAFANVFPHTTLWYDGTSVLLIGSRDRPLEVDLDRFAARIEQPGVRDNLSLIDTPGPWLLLSTYIAGPRGVRAMIGSDVPDNTDDRPYLEYAVLRAGRLEGNATAANLEMLASHVEPLERHVTISGMTAERREKLTEIRGLMAELLQVRIHQERDETALAHQALLDTARRYGLQNTDLEFLRPFLARLEFVKEN